MPSLRGVVHLYGFYIFLIAGVVLVSMTGDSALRWVIVGYTGSLVALFGISAVYHRVAWSLKTRPWIRRLDHCMIFVAIAGSLSPFVFALGADKGQWVTEVIWLSVAAGILTKLFWINAPDWVSACMYVAVSWVAIVIFPDIAEAVGSIAVGLLLLGGGFYSVGAVIYAMNRPNPWPQVFGYHEIFHLLVLLGAGTHFVAVTFFVVL
jgi:hemolysin III